MKGNISKARNSVEFDLGIHKSAPVIDHPNGSVTEEKLDATLREKISSIPELSGDMLARLKTKAGKIIENGGEIFNNYEDNKAVSLHSHSEGDNTSAGHKAFGFNSHEYTEADYTDKENNIGKYYVNTVVGITAGINYSVILKNNYNYNGIVVSVGEDYIEVNNYILPNTDSKTTISDSSYIIFPDNPEIQGDKIIGIAAHSEGKDTKAMADSTHTEGYNTKASGKYGHVEGKDSIAGGYASHAENNGQALGFASHAENNSTAIGERSHAQGYKTKSIGNGSHSGGYMTIALGEYQHVQGKCNIPDEKGKYAHIVGKGTSENNRANAHTIDWSGNAWFSGEVRTGGTSYDDGEVLSTKGYVNSKVSEEAAARGISESVFEERIKKIKYYGDADIEISPDEWFTFEDDGHTILTGFAEDHKNETSVVIPYSVTNIAMAAFCDCTGLTNVIIPKSVKAIGDSSFSGCTGLKSVEIPDSVTSIEYGAFSYCTNLEKIVIPSSVRHANYNVFLNCSKAKVYCPQNFAAEAMFVCGVKPESIVYLDMSLDSKVTKDGENAVSGGAVYNALLTNTSQALPQTLAVNTIYDLGEQNSLTLNLPAGQLGDFIEVDFLSTNTPTTLTITASSGISDYDLVPEENTIYSLYFNWIRLDASTYGWGFGYAEYTRTVA